MFAYYKIAYVLHKLSIIYMYILLNSIILFILHNKETIIYKIKVDSTLCLYLQKQCTFIQLFREKKKSEKIFTLELI